MSRVSGARLNRRTTDVPNGEGVKNWLRTDARTSIKEVWFNPGAKSDALIEKAEEWGVQPIVACSVLGVGRNLGEM